MSYRKFGTLLVGVLVNLTMVPAIAQYGTKLVILHTNDMHSRLDGFAPSINYTPGSINDDNTTGGFSRIASIIKEERFLNPENTLVLDAGDFLMGTIYHYMEEYNGFQLPLMYDMGYDVVAIGNHEFDYGPGTLAKIIKRSSSSSDIPKLLLGNALFDDGDHGDNSFEALFDNNIITRSVIIEKQGHKVGIFSLMGIDADEVAPFAPPVKFSRQVRAARRMVRKLNKSGADVIICLSHSGLEKNKKGEWAGEDVKLAKKVRGLDLVISAHTHTKISEPIIIKGVPVVQAGCNGMFVGRVELDINGDEIKLSAYNLIPVDDSVTGDPLIQSRIDNQKELISDQLLNPLNYNIDSVIVESSYELVCDEYGGDLENSNLGPLVVDAIHNYVNNNVALGTDVSMVAAGVIRDRVVPGQLTVQDVFRMMSLGSGKDNIPGYPLSRIWVTGIELNRILEVLLVAYKSAPSNYCYFAGIMVDFDPGKGLLRKVKSINLVKADGTTVPVDLSKGNETLYSITANAYMLEFVGIIKKTTFGLVNVVPKESSGIEIENMSDAILDFNADLSGVQEGKEWIALVEFFRNMTDSNGDLIPDLDNYYKDPPRRIIPIMH
ncbi:MAG TPA: bifunctional UDP-sugar hydrolase/5'-nucleotidase [Bacteroidales bacterium]|nr:bifunctional UDP-sugar hydrolase/5'-nucleotidase [Bacteroidales bacterium]